MIDKYLVKTGPNNNIQFIEDWDQVLHIIKVATFEWCDSPNYEGESWEVLFNNCLRDKNFGDIANVFELQGTLEEKFPKPNHTVQFKRVL